MKLPVLLLFLCASGISFSQDNGLFPESISSKEKILVLITPDESLYEPGYEKELSNYRSQVIPKIEARLKKKYSGELEVILKSDLDTRDAEYYRYTLEVEMMWHGGKTKYKDNEFIFYNKFTYLFVDLSTGLTYTKSVESAIVETSDSLVFYKAYLKQLQKRIID